ncbi:Fic family protein [candidate division KSB1 bacterium]|nr:Fic family protein [candidate division KSB1 bacterium]
MTNKQKFLNYTRTFHPLDISKLIKIPAKYENLLEQVNRLKSALDSFRPLSPIVVKNLTEVYAVKFTYNSNAIEGSTLTERETALVLEKGLTIGGKPLRDHLEAQGHQKAIEWIRNIAKQPDRPISEKDILELHRIVFYKVDEIWAGKYRTVDVQIAGTNKIFPSFFDVPELMSQFISWLNSLEAHQLPTVERAAEAHYRLVDIHPFVDGNGRVTRLLMNLILLGHGFPIAVITNEKRSDYLSFLEQADQKNFLPFKKLIFEAVRNSLCDYLNIVAPAETEKNKGSDFYEYIMQYL